MKDETCIPFVAVICLLVAMPCGADVYKWVDESGRVHYGDRPEKHSSEQIDIDHITRTNPSDNGMSREETRARLLQSMEEDRLDREKKRVEQQQARQRERRYCNNLRDNLRQLNLGTRLYTLDENGDRVYVSDTNREQHRKKTLAQIRKYCR